MSIVEVVMVAVVWVGSALLIVGGIRPMGLTGSPSGVTDAYYQATGLALAGLGIASVGLALAIVIPKR